jgi:ParG protein
VQMKRFTLDVPLELHTRIKTQCASEGLKMTDVLREMLELRFPAKS